MSIKDVLSAFSIGCQNGNVSCLTSDPWNYVAECRKGRVHTFDAHKKSMHDLIVQIRALSLSDRAILVKMIGQLKGQHIDFSEKEKQRFSFIKNTILSVGNGELELNGFPAHLIEILKTKEPGYQFSGKEIYLAWYEFWKKNNPGQAIVFPPNLRQYGYKDRQEIEKICKTTERAHRITSTVLGRGSFVAWLVGKFSSFFGAKCKIVKGSTEIAADLMSLHVEEKLRVE
jgi:hypothetical protein